jgi:hypothetical protein
LTYHVFGILLEKSNFQICGIVSGLLTKHLRTEASERLKVSHSILACIAFAPIDAELEKIIERRKDVRKFPCGKPRRRRKSKELCGRRKESKLE